MQGHSHYWDVPMPIKLDWRFGALERVAQVRMKELKTFSRQAETHFADAMEAWNKEATGLTDEEESMMGDYLIERRDNIESMLDRGYTFGVLGLSAFLERFLNEAVDHLRAGGAKIPESQRAFNLHQLRAHLQSVGIDMNAPPFDWTALSRLREVRNCIAHTDGWITDDFAIRLNRLGMDVKADTPLRLPEKFFQRCWTLVDETREHVYNMAWEQFGYKKQHEMWLRPTRSFAELELREILHEAVTAGSAAAEAATTLLLQKAKKKG